ncbi:MAG: DUF86 domain-containing protein [Candidatus Kapabacteria bacterium]|nr:DUF86 domain-containing protein [Ignavibacteriota bacterium]MCW5884076.1 DUF86 domain-containing protein [Candidatus Kapabacteria bacterium]
MSFDNFSDDDKTIDAVIRNFEIIGEASNHLPKDFKLKYADIDWRALTDFRNVIIHEYFGISIEIIWDIIENELPNLEPNIKKLLDDGNIYGNP